MEGLGPLDCRECLSPLSQLGAAGTLLGLAIFLAVGGRYVALLRRVAWGSPSLIYANHLFKGQLTYLLCLSAFLVYVWK